MATAAASRHDGVNVDFQKTLLEQETLINNLNDDRDKLRKLVEDQKQSLEIRKKNLRILPRCSSASGRIEAKQWWRVRLRSRCARSMWKPTRCLISSR